VVETIQIFEYYPPIKDHRDMIGHHETHPAHESYEMHVLQDHQLNDFHKHTAVVSLHKMMVDFIIKFVNELLSLFKLS
jgi:hypothetical protein